MSRTNSHLVLAHHHFSKICRSANAKAATLVLQDLRAHLRVAEDLIAKLGYQVRELQKLGSRAPRVHEFKIEDVSSIKISRQVDVLVQEPHRIAKVLQFKKCDNSANEALRITE